MMSVDQLLFFAIRNKRMNSVIVRLENREVRREYKTLNA